jgi:3-methyladenine DNA glycosylase/8-oxoguanine DNA glycosylase
VAHRVDTIWAWNDSYYTRRHRWASRLVAHDPVVARWLKVYQHPRITRTGTIWEHLIPTITGQKVPGENNRASWQGILRRWGQPPPGPTPPAARRRIEAICGLGPWSSSIVVMLGLGDPDSVIVGDYQIPSYVAWHLAGERRAEDPRMLELLEPYKGQRARVQAFAKMAGAPPRPPQFDMFSRLAAFA